MKHILLSFLTVIIAGAIIAQQVPRDKVVVEEATGTW
jgi:hypothetical protein